MNPNKNIKPPIAIIGMGCRFPGNASNPKAFWELLKNQMDAVIDVPNDRWDIRRFYDPNTEKPGKMHARQAGFLKENIFEWDPLFFGISPREAETIDPQQRLLLEVTYEAIEDAGLQLELLKGSNAGVFIGGFTLDQLLWLNKDNRELINSLTAVSVMMTMLSNKLSYIFDLRGPSVSMDTACSSSLVTTHYACQSIWNGECSLAIAGGVNVMLKPEMSIAMSKGQFLSKHGRCKTFDREASGYARGEGAGVVLLKSYPQAIKDKDSIYALITATGINQDGRTHGISAPNPESQEALIRKIYEQTNIDVNNIHYVEAHGTGTSIGDRVELQSLNTVLSAGRKPENKCLVGSVKTNIGHLEAGAGIAGVIKTALCLKNNQVPPNLHFNTPNPEIDFEQLCLKIPTQMENLPGDEPSLASINSFGYGGTNAHVVLQQVPLPTAAEKGTLKPIKKPFIIPLTARDDEALKELAGKYHDFLHTHNIQLRDFIYSTSQRRSHHNNRAALVAQTKEELMEKLISFSKGMLLKGIVTNHANSDEKPKLVFVYTGMGPQWWKMGRELMDTEPLFRQKLEECDQLFYKHAGWSILKELLADEEHSRMAETQVAQPANFLIQAALSDLLKAYGIVPDAVVGHSVGEVTAAYVSGALSLEDAILVSYHRSRLQQKTAGSGTMLAIGLGETEAKDLISNFENVSAAAINSPNSITLSGKEETLQQIARLLESKEIFNRMLKVEVPYHSYLMDPIREELFSCLKDIQAKEQQIPIYSTVTGGLLHGSEFDADYWWANVREPVKFARAIEAIVNDGCDIFLEVGPHPVLRNSIKECLHYFQAEGHLVPTLNRKEPEALHFFESLATLFTLGFPLNWPEISPGGNFIRLPSYPWQRKRYWKESAASLNDRRGLEDNVFFNEKVQTPGLTWEVELNELFFPFINDHVVQDTVVFPGAAYAAAGLALSRKKFNSDSAITLEQMEFKQILPIFARRKQILRTAISQATNTYSIYSRIKEDDQEWKLHATGRMLEKPIAETAPIIDINEIKARCSVPVAPAEIYHRLKTIKLEYGPYFRTIKEAWKGNKNTGNSGEMLAKIKGHDSLTTEPEEYLIHPTILDGSFQAMVVFDDNNDKEIVPVSMGRVNWFHSPGPQCWAHIRIKQITSHSITGDITLCDENGKVAVEIEDLVCREILRRDVPEEEQHNITQWFYDFKWQESGSISPAPKTKSSPWLVFANENGYSNELSRQLALENISWVRVTPGDRYEKITPHHYQIRSQSPQDMQRLLTENVGVQFPEVLYLWAMETADADSYVSHTVDQCMPVIYLTQALAKVRPDENIKITIVTRDSQVVIPGDRGDTGLTAAPLWGLGHLVRNEFPAVTPKIIDLEKRAGWQSHPPADEIQQLANELLADNRDEDVALRGQQRFVKILARTPGLGEEENNKYKTISTETPVELTYSSTGKIENLYFREFQCPKPGPGEITIKVHASAINYKDVLKVLGLVDPAVTEGTYFRDTLGMEVSGVVTGVGEGVSGYQVGDEVVTANPSGNFKSYITVKPAMIHHKPQMLSHAEAVILVPYLTVLHGLEVVAQLQKGEKILIHNATGGVGLAAIQYAQWKEAEIFATAGNPEKREYLKSIGIKHVMDSRSLTFARTIKELTNGYGVDVVISAMQGEALRQSFSLLAPYGRYIEIGKRDIISNQNLPMKVFNRNIVFASVDLDRMLLERKERVQKLLKDVFKGFEQGYFRAMPTEVFPAANVVDAFKKMMRAAHIGKIVLDFHNQEIKVEKNPETIIKADATYLITGGTRGLGLEIAKWLSANGATHIVIISRSGAQSEEARQAINRMERQGTTVLAAAKDVTREKDIKELLEQVTRTMPPLSGIFHGAMVLDDAFLVDMDKDRFSKVMEPKVAGVLNLHKYTKDLPLDFFINFSSISSLVGNPGQANYIAANAFLDAFAHYRDALGLPCTTINLGALKEVGVASRNEHVERILEGSGIKGLTTRDTLKAIQWVIKQKPVQIGIFDMDWQQWAETNQRSIGSSRFQNLAKENQSGNEAHEKKSLKLQLLQLDRNERLKNLEKLVKDGVSEVLKLDPEKIDSNRGLNHLGIDSIMVAELVRTLNKTFALDISPVAFLSGPNIRQVAVLIDGKISNIKN